MHHSISKYTIGEKLGEGATAEVYRAIDTSLDRQVALKLLKPALVADGMISGAPIDAIGEAGEGMYFSGPDLYFSGVLYDELAATYEYDLELHRANSSSGC